MENECNTREYAWDEIKKHNSMTDCWVVVNNKVFDVTEFLVQIFFLFTRRVSILVVYKKF